MYHTNIILIINRVILEKAKKKKKFLKSITNTIAPTTIAHALSYIDFIQKFQ